MRPRVKSYGESSTATLSPARMRMKFLRILPETCASTWCLFSSSTRNIAFGNGSITVAITSIASSFEFPESLFFFSSNGCFAIVSQSCKFSVLSFKQSNPYLRLRTYYLLLPSPRWPGHLFRPGQDPGAVARDGDGVLEVRRWTAIGSFGDPFAAHLHFRAAGIHHRFDGDDHAFLQTRPASRFSIVRKIGFIVHLRSDAVPHRLPHHRESVLLDPALHRVPDIAQPVARAHFIDRAIQRFAGHIQELLHLRADLSHGHGDGRIGVIAVDLHAEVDRNHFAFAQLALRRGNPVNDLAVHRRAQHAGIPAIPLERGLAGPAGDEPLGNSFEVHRRHSGFYFRPKLVQDFMHHLARAVHLFEFSGAA